MNFDLLAPHYRWLEFVLAGNKLQRCRTAFLKKAAPPGSVLIAGEGNGRFLCECRRLFRAVPVTCVDRSDRMLELARRRLALAGLPVDGVQFVRADILTWVPPEQAFDLVVTHFFLDCFRPAEVERAVRTLARAAKPRATWLLADFQLPQAGWRRFRAGLIHRLMYASFRLTARLSARELTPPDPALQASGFVLRQRMIAEWGLLHTDEWRRGV